MTKNWVRGVACALCLFFAGVGTIHAGTIGFELACDDELVLRDVIQNYVPVDRNGVPTVNCSLLPDEAPLNSFVPVDRIIADCVIDFCEVTIIRAEYQSQLFYIALGWIGVLDPDAFVHFVELYDPILPFGYPPAVEVLEEDRQLLAKLVE